MAKVSALVLTGFGLNCDYETAHAFELAGAASHCVHINSLVDGSVRLEDLSRIGVIVPAEKDERISRSILITDKAAELRTTGVY